MSEKELKMFDVDAQLDAVFGTGLMLSLPGK